jgi:acyl-ACP thioesterase
MILFSEAPMLNTYDETFVLRPRDCDLNEKWRPSAILETMQDAAGAHCELLGCGREKLIKRNIVWVLTRCELHMDRYPKCGETITVHTFPTPNRICFFPRYYIFTDQRGEMVGKAGTLWLLLDLETRRMLPPGDIGKLIPDNKDLSVPMNLPATVGKLQGEEFVSTYRPVYTDLDVNGHVNNTRYADWLCNTLGIDLMTEYLLSLKHE